MSSFGLYIHWPFCKAKCPYCDFNSHVRENIDSGLWQDSLLKELDYWANRTDERVLTSIFFGGGTPSLMPPDTVAALISAAKDYWPAAPDIEISLEANPTSVEAGKLRDFKAAGINRLSLGIQSLHDDALKALGRQHSAAEAMTAIKLAAQTFDRFSFDLIYARPDHQVEAWREELTRALDFGPHHLSVYQLTIEPGTKFATLWQRGDLVIPDDDTGAALYDVTQEILEARDLPAYEVSNHAALGQECRHNLTYWRYEDYVGIGPGAHGRVTIGQQKLATRTHRAPEEWLARINSYGHGLVEETPVPLEDQRDEMLLMGLRLREGIALEKLAAYGITLNPGKVEILQRHNLITLDNHRLTATPDGRLRLNALIAELAV